MLSFSNVQYHGHPRPDVSDEKSPLSLGSTSLKHRETMRDVLKHETFLKMLEKVVEVGESFACCVLDVPMFDVVHRVDWVAIVTCD